MRILALEPYYGGSHQAFLDGWIKRSTHDWTLLTLPAYKWKWRMRHSAVTLAEEVQRLLVDGDNPAGDWDLIFCSDMLPLAEFLGLVHPDVSRLPTVLYFHENQLTYPNQAEHQQGGRDHHFAFTNLVSALAADRVWFNSEYHLDEFFGSFKTFLQRMPDYDLTDRLIGLRQRCCVQSPGIDDFSPRSARRPGPLRIVWNARWEHDKNPDLFFAALRKLHQTTDFRLAVVGESFEASPDIFGQAKMEFADRITHWGFVEDRKSYDQILQDADVVVSTAEHEFFGISILEAASAGAVPVVPNRLAYPETFKRKHKENELFFYDGSIVQFVKKLVEFSTWAEAASVGSDERLSKASLQARILANEYSWSRRAPAMDSVLARIVG